MKILVTGASGFVGRHVIAELQKYEIDIIAVTRSAKRLLCFDKKVNIIETDITTADETFYTRVGQPDILIHLAWEGLPNYRELYHFDRELPRQYCFLKHLVEAGLQTLVITGTCFEYGMQNGMLSEDMIPRPENPYGYAKNALRRQLTFFYEFHPCNLVWARIFYMYGSGQPESSLYSQLRAAVFRGDKAFNMSGGEQLRDYLRVEEVASLLVKLALAQKNVGIVNVCSGKPISVRALVEKWLCENRWDIQLNLGHYDYPDYEPMAFWGDRMKLNRILAD